jgi:hypothetical protein
MVDRKPFPTTFEQAAARLEQLPMLYFEYDGSFVWARDKGKQHIFGMLYDADGRLQYCQLQGKGSLETWKMLLAAITGDPSVDRFELLRLPDQQLQDLQSFEETIWPVAARSNDCEPSTGQPKTP